MSKKLIFFDFDSTLMDCETIDELAKVAGVGDQVKEITKEAMGGRLNFEQSLKKRVSLLKGLPFEKAMGVAMSLKPMPGAKETVQEMKKRGYTVVVVSGGFTIATERIKYEFGLDAAYSNTLGVKDGLLTGEVSGPMTRDISKGEMLQYYQEHEGFTKENTVVVGDGANDLSMFPYGGLKVAFCAKPVLKEKADVTIDVKDLTKLLDYVK